MDLARDAGLRVALQVARSWGVSPSEFFGEPRRSWTEYEYDDLGRLIRSVTVTEPAWTQADREYAFALADYEADLCSGCGQPLAETTLREHEFAYVRDELARCHRCTAQDGVSKGFEQSPSPHALHFSLRLDRARVAENLARMEAERGDRGSSSAGATGGTPDGAEGGGEPGTSAEPEQGVQPRSETDAG